MEPVQYPLVHLLDLPAAPIQRLVLPVIEFPLVLRPASSCLLLFFSLPEAGAAQTPRHKLHFGLKLALQDVTTKQLEAAPAPSREVLRTPQSPRLPWTPLSAPAPFPPGSQHRTSNLANLYVKVAHKITHPI
ncbi:hypothetical protein MDA_GLEAN10011328 [Myotis davidii]|uniref:Uncharacterized protein n=1 Tax=Myotis davidii TaxID=225400 RepID=L5M487_MYODS|nr:hypothetical protein MDA_GLEAN10011328 [Myotis davidii]